MNGINRRRFLTLSAGALAMGSLGFPMIVLGAKPRVIIVGGGIAGATTAQYLRKANTQLEIILIEPKKTYHTCFMSNEVLASRRNLDSIAFDYEGLRKKNIRLIHDRVSAIDPMAKTVRLSDGKSLDYQACVVAPGISFRWDSIKGYHPELAQTIPHAYHAGQQTQILQKQISQMHNGGTFIIVAPPNPFRCPPGPYERASQIAWYFKQHKPKSKIIILDPKPKFSKMALFTDGWERYYGYNSQNSLIEWVSGSAGGAVGRLDSKRMQLKTAAGSFHGDVINVIPAQQAGEIAHQADLTDESGWCPVHHQSFESTKYPNIYIVGDACIASPMPKSGYAANSQAKVCAAAITARLNGQSLPIPSYVNTCYSLITPDDGISVAMVYKLGAEGKIVKVDGAGGLTSRDSTDEDRRREVNYAYSWFKNITHDTFA